MNEYTPDCVSSPAETIADLISEKGLRVTADLADALERWSGVPAGSWLNSDRAYREYNGLPNIATPPHIQRYALRHDAGEPVMVSRTEFDWLCEQDRFVETRMSTGGTEYGEPYHPEREAWGLLIDGWCVWTVIGVEA